MQSDAVHALEGLTGRVRDINDSSTRLEALRDSLQEEVVAKEVEIETLGRKITSITKVGELFRVLMDRLVNDQVHAVESVVTEGLQTIFSDQNLSFEATVGPFRNKISVDFFIRQGDKDDPLSIRGRPLDAFGGGPSSVSSLILKVLTLIRLKRSPILVLDETLSAVGDTYVDHTGRFLQKLASSMSIDVLLVTHQQLFLEHADKSYRCHDVVDGSSRHLTLRSVS